MLKELVRRSRTYRRFNQDVPVSVETLRALVDLGRLSPSASNLQPLKYVLSTEPGMNARVFQTLGWAGYLRDWPGPEEGERPSAYIVIVGDTAISRDFECDLGIAAQTIMLGAAEIGLGGCMIKTFRRTDLADALGISSGYQILLVLALGAPSEVVVLEPLPPDGSVRYWRDDAQTHHVPKRSLEDIIIGSR